jgi:hypothetical protein
MGAEVQAVTGGCCGLAGSWGFESGKYDISVECGEQALLPAVREAPRQTAVVANGFSCKTQIEQAGTGRRALHLAEVMKLARDGGEQDALRPPEERLDARRPVPGVPVRLARTAGPIVALVAGAAGVVGRLRR